MTKVTKHNVTLRLPVDLHAAFVEKAQKRRMPLSVWITQACLAYEAKSEKFAKRRAAAAKYEPCSLCGKRHDRNEHFGNPGA